MSSRGTTWLAVGFCGIALTLLATGCGASSDENVIRVSRNIGGREGFRRHFDTWKATFERNNPGWTMELIDLGNEEGAAYYKSRIATNDLPEVVMTWQLTNFLADGGYLVPIPDSYYEKFGITKPEPYKGQFYTSMDGLQVQGIVVNKAMWADIGVTEPPATWDEYFECFRKLDAKGHKPLVFGGREWSAGQPLFYAIASDLYARDRQPGEPSWTIRKDRGEISFATDPVARQIMEKMIYFVENFAGKGTMSNGYNEEQRDFYGGNGATWMMGCWMAGDIEPNRVAFEMAYWPVPSLLGRPPIFIQSSGLQSGWAVTASAKGAKLDKAMDVLETFYDPQVYQIFLNGECQFSIASNIAVTGPQSDWGPARNLFADMKANIDRYGTARGYNIALDDLPPPNFTTTMARVMQEILAGTRDVDALLRMLDEDWESARKGA